MKKRAAILLFLLVFSSVFLLTKGQDSLALSYELAGSSYDRQGNWEEALRNWLKALTVYTKLGDTAKEAAVLDNIANKYYQYGVYKKSAEYYEKKGCNVILLSSR
jgi:tetratricopeptide (TPR) repeat protein